MTAAPATPPASTLKAAGSRVDVGRSRIDRDTTVLVVLAWALVVVPRIVQSLTSPKYRTVVGDPVPLSAPASHFDEALFLALAAWCFYVLLVRIHDLPTTRRTELVLLLLPWFYIVSRDLYLDQRPDRGSYVYALLVVALWVLRPRLNRLAALGYLVGVTALISITLGVFLPSKGIYTAVTGELIAPDKQILPGGLLIGTFTDSNNLGQFLVLGLPAIGLVPRRVWQVVLAAATFYAIVWTSSRSSIIAAVAGAAMAVVMIAVPRSARRPCSIMIMSGIGLAAIAIPMLNTSDTAYTNRGVIWRESLASWAGNPVVGLGSNWYQNLAQYANPLGGLAYHGHNQFVQTLVTGGLILAALFLVLSVAVIRTASSWAARGRVYPTVYVVVILVSCMFEVSFGLVDRDFLAAVAILQVAFVLLAERPVGPGSAQASTMVPRTAAPASRRASSPAS